MSDLKKQLIKLGSTNPELRPHIRQIIGSTIDTHLEYFKEVEKNLAQEILGMILPSVKPVERPTIHGATKGTTIRLVLDTKADPRDDFDIEVFVTSQGELKVTVKKSVGQNRRSKSIDFMSPHVYDYTETLHQAAKAVTPKAKKPRYKSELTMGDAFDSYFESLWLRMFKTMSAKNLMRRPLETSDFTGDGLLNRKIVLQYAHGTYETYIALGQNYVGVSITELRSVNNPRADREIMYETGTFEECDGIIQKAQKTLSDISRQ